MRFRWIAISALALTCGLARGDEFVGRNGNAFEVCGHPFKFVGFNVRGICHFGRGDVLPYSHTSDIATNLNYCVNAGSRVIRVFCAANTVGPVQTGDRLGAVLDACQQRGIYVIVSLTDMYGNTLMYPQGDNGYYFASGGYLLLSHTFFAGGYTQNYLPQAVYLADRFKDHPALFAWQIGNEIRDLSSGSTFVTFCQNVAAQIRAADPNHMVSVGLIGYRESNISYNQALQIYGAMDFVGTHNYMGSDYNNDSNVAGALNLPYIIDEAGFDGTGRPAKTDGDISKWLARGVDGYLQWGLMATAYDNGDGDRVVGVDPVFHAVDFLQYQSLFASWGASFAVPPELAIVPQQIVQTVPQGSAGVDDVFAVFNVGDGDLTFSASESATWMSLDPTSGPASCVGTSVTIHYEFLPSVPGQYVEWIDVTAVGATNSPQQVQVTLIIEGHPGDFDGDRDVDQEDFGRIQACITGPGLPVSNPACYPARLDADADVDDADVGLFLGCMSGPDVQSDPACTQP